jgi:hypothetical protein
MTHAFVFLREWNLPSCDTAASLQRAAWDRGGVRVLIAVGFVFGSRWGSCSDRGGVRVRIAVGFVVGFWLGKPIIQLVTGLSYRGPTVLA